MTIRLAVVDLAALPIDSYRAEFLRLRLEESALAPFTPSNLALVALVVDRA